MEVKPSKIVSAQKEIIVIAPVGPIRVRVPLFPEVLQPLRVQGVLPLAAVAAATASAAAVVLVVVPVSIVVLILVHFFVPRRAVSSRVAVFLRLDGMRVGAAGVGQRLLENPAQNL